MKTKLTPILLLLTLASCSKDARRLYHHERTLYHAGKADLKLCKDTIIHDTVITDRYVHDTTFSYTHDTTRYETERVIVEHHYDHHTNTVYQKVECKTDTIIKAVEVPREVRMVIDRTPKWVAFFLDWYWLLIVLLVAYLIIRVLRKLKVI